MNLSFFNWRLVLKKQLDEPTRQSTELNIDTEQIIRAFNYSKELLLSDKLPMLKQLINLYVERVDIYPDSVNVSSVLIIHTLQHSVFVVFDFFEEIWYNYDILVCRKRVCSAKNFCG